MAEFLELLPPQNAIEKLMSYLDEVALKNETIKTEDGLQRVIAKDIIANEEIPAFTRSTVDGFAVNSRDTYGASEAIPAFFEIIGEIKMGKSADYQLKKGQVCLIHTGGMLPAGADAVIMVENTQYSNLTEIEIYKAVSSGENVVMKGEDIKEGDLVFSKGTKLRPVEIGALMALGITEVPVYQIPHVGIVSTGDELVQPNENPKLGEVRDINTYTLSSIVKEMGGIPKNYPIVRDNEEKLFLALKKAHQENDLVIATAGSSASVRDFTAKAISKLGEPGVLVHGINVRPGKPTILAFADKKPIVGLPGNPVSAFVIAHMVLKSLLPKLRGELSSRTKMIKGLVTINMSSMAGREDWFPIRFTGDYQNGIPLVEPIFYKSNLIFTLISANGLARIEPNRTGLDELSEVEILLI